MFSLVKRNISLFFSDKVAVFFSLLGALIAVLLIMFFLKPSIVDSMVISFGGLATHQDAENLLDAWLIVSACVIASGTTGLAGLGYFVQDRERARWRDFLVSPLPRWALTGGYLLSATLISVIMTTLVYIAGTTYCWATGVPLSLGGVLESWGWLMVCSLAFTGLMGFLVSMLTTEQSFVGLTVVIGTTFGFLAQTYVTASLLPTGVRDLLSSLPFAQASALVRKPYTHDVIAGLPEIVHAPTMEAMGITLSIGTTQVSTPMILTILVVMTVVCTLACWQIMTRSMDR
ncbi:MAG: hypothetical protein LBG99_09570 [Propionibacteriaceae bacterium]|jgi:multidrug/hemolysin transport system permease protein|nr:hypothetical protein [Propionibacteriaceae bacterium]